MSLSLGDIFLYLKGDDTHLNKTLDKAEGKAQSWAGKVGGFLGGALQFAAGGLIETGINGVMSAIGGVTDSMISGNAAFENYEQKFTVLLGSADEAQDRLAALAEFGAKTPFELPEVVEADTVLQGFGLHSEEAAKKFGFAGDEIRTIAGDVASGTGSSFQEMALLIGKFSAGATGEAISRMQELGITNRDELAKMGLEFSKSGELLSPLPESMNVILGLMKDKYGGLMEAQSTTFTGMMSNLQDWVSGTLRTIGQPIFEVLKDKLQGTLTFLGSPTVQGAVATFAGMLSNGIGAAIDYLNPILTMLINTITQLVVNGKSIQWLFTIFEDGSSWFSTFLEKLGLSEPVALAVNSAFALVVSGLQQLGTWAVQIGQAALPILGQAFSFLMNNANIILPILGTIGAVILAISSPVTALAGLVVLLATAWANNWGNIQGIVAGVMATLQPYFDQLSTILNNFISLILPPLQLAWQTLVQVWTTEVQPALAELWATLGQLFTELGFGTGQTDVWSIALGLLKLALAGAVTVVRLLTPAIKLGADILVFMINQVKSGIENFIKFKHGIEGIIGVISRLIERIKALAAELIDLAIPDWLTPGSPTPFEMGLRGIAGAIDNLPELTIGANVAGASPLAAAAAGAGGGNSFGDINITIPGAGDPGATAQAVRRELEALFNRTRR